MTKSTVSDRIWNMIKQCIVCGKDIAKGKLSISQFTRKKFCSHKCHGSTLKIEETVKCELCGKIVTRKKRSDSKSRFCSIRCAVNNASKIALVDRDFNGSNNPAWKGGVTSENRKQRKIFLKEIHKSILKRDNYTCRICGVRGEKLQVDHIKPWSKDIDSRFAPENCRTLCVGCHYKHTFGYPMPEGSEWGKRYENRDL